LRAVATDGHRLARVEIPLPEGAVGMPDIIIPRDAVGEILKLLKGSKEDEVAIGVSPFAITLAIGTTRLTSKLVDGTFPDYQRAIPRRNDKVANAERDDLLRAADRVSTISSERGRAVRLRFSEDALELAVTNPDAGSSSDEVEIDYAGTPVEIGFNARYLLDALGAIEGDVVKIALFDAGSPALITSAVEDRFLIALMPMRV
jgi:DNA polymerase-3 subunit beta